MKQGISKLLRIHKLHPNVAGRREPLDIRGSTELWLRYTDMGTKAQLRPTDTDTGTTAQLWPTDTDTETKA